MRKTVLTLLFPLTLLLVACNSGSQSGAAPESADQANETQSAMGSVITGSVTVQPGAASSRSVSSNAKLELTLEDISQQPAVPIANKTIQPLGQLPIQFQLDFNPDRVIPDDILIIVAKIVDGDRNFTMPLQQQVLTKGKSNQVQITLVPEPTAGEKMMVEFRNVQGQLGGMKISKGTALGEHTSRAWQIFRKNNHIQFVVDIEDNFDTNARTRTDYAYREREPWIVIQKLMPKAGAEPDSIKRAGWDKDGKLVLRDLVANGDTSNLSGADAQSLRQQAQAMFKKSGDK